MQKFLHWSTNLFLLIFIAYAGPANGNNHLDSLMQLSISQIHDTVRINTWNKIAEHYRFIQSDSAYKYSEKARILGGKSGFGKGLADAYHNLGLVYLIQGEYNKALEMNKTALKIRIDLKNADLISASFNNLGLSYECLGQYNEALENYQFALEICRENNIVDGEIAAIGNVANIYYFQSDFPTALEYHFKALKIQQKSGDSIRMAATFNNLALVYNAFYEFNNSVENMNLSLENYFKAQSIYENLDDKRNLCRVLTNIGTQLFKLKQYNESRVYMERSLKLSTELNDAYSLIQINGNMGSLYLSLAMDSLVNDEELSNVNIYLARKPQHPELLDTALKYRNIALNLVEKTGDIQSLINQLNGLGSIYTAKKDFKKAIEYFTQSRVMADSIGAKREVRTNAKNLFEIYDFLGDAPMALNNLKTVMNLTDSLFNEDKSKDIGKIEAKHEFELQERNKKVLLEKEEKQQMETEKRRNLLQYSSISLVLIISLFLLLFIGKARIPIALTEGMVFFVFLLIFEFLLVLFDPSIEQWTGGVPVYKLLINSLLAAVIFPLHAFFERLMKRRLSESKDGN